MRFLLLTQYFPPEIGAPQIRLAALARVLRKCGHEVEIVTALPHHLTGQIYPEYRRRFYVEECVEGNRIIRSWAYAATGAGARRLLNYASFTITCCLGLSRAKRPDYIFVESPPLFLGIPGALYSTFRRVPMIFNVADLWPDSVRQLGILTNRTLLSIAELLESWIYKKSRYVNAMTIGIREDLLKLKHVPGSKLLFLPNGVDTALFAPSDPDPELARKLHLEGCKVFIYAGTHGVAQGLDTLLEAAALVRERSIKLLMVGDGPAKQRLIEKTTELGLDNVTFLGMQPVADMPQFFSIATASIVPLVKNELFKGARPSKIFSSLAAGIPVIFCGEGESADLLVNNKAGLVVSPQNAQALAAAMRRLDEDAELCKELGANGRALVLNQFDWNAIVERWLEQLSNPSPASAV